MLVMRTRGEGSADEKALLAEANVFLSQHPFYAVTANQLAVATGIYLRCEWAEWDDGYNPVLSRELIKTFGWEYARTNAEPRETPWWSVVHEFLAWLEARGKKVEDV